MSDDATIQVTTIGEALRFGKVARKVFYSFKAHGSQRPRPTEKGTFLAEIKGYDKDAVIAATFDGQDLYVNVSQEN